MKLFELYETAHLEEDKDIKYEIRNTSYDNWAVFAPRTPTAEYGPTTKEKAAAWVKAHKKKNVKEAGQSNFNKMSREQLVRWIQRNDSDEPGMSPVFGERIKAAYRTLKQKGWSLKEDDFEWEPQPEFKGVQGKSQDSGFGIDQAKQAKQKQQNSKLNDTWKKLLTRYQKSDSSGRKSFLPHLQKMAAEAQKRGFTLSPDPKTVLS